MTPAFLASSIRYSSSFLVLKSLSCLYVTVMASNGLMKLGLLLCVFHLLILSIYSVVLSPPIHSYLSYWTAGIFDGSLREAGSDYYPSGYVIRCMGGGGIVEGGGRSFSLQLNRRNEISD